MREDNCSECTIVEELLPAYDDGELEGAQLSQVEEHLKTCSVCQHTLESMRTVWDSLLEWPDLEPSADYRCNFWERVGREESQQHGPAELSTAPEPLPFKPAARLWNRTWQGAAAAAVLACAFWGGTLFGSNPDVQHNNFADAQTALPSQTTALEVQNQPDQPVLNSLAVRREYAADSSGMTQAVTDDYYPYYEDGDFVSSELLDEALDGVDYQSF